MDEICIVRVSEKGVAVWTKASRIAMAPLKKPTIIVETAGVSVLPVPVHIHDAESCRVINLKHKRTITMPVPNYKSFRTFLPMSFLFEISGENTS